MLCRQPKVCPNILKIVENDKLQNSFSWLSWHNSVDIKIVIIYKNTHFCQKCLHYSWFWCIVIRQSEMTTNVCFDVMSACYISKITHLRRLWFCSRFLYGPLGLPWINLLPYSFTFHGCLDWFLVSVYSSFGKICFFLWCAWLIIIRYRSLVCWMFWFYLIYSWIFWFIFTAIDWYWFYRFCKLLSFPAFLSLFFSHTEEPACLFILFFVPVSVFRIFCSCILESGLFLRQGLRQPKEIGCVVW